MDVNLTRGTSAEALFSQKGPQHVTVEHVNNSLTQVSRFPSHSLNSAQLSSPAPHRRQVTLKQKLMPEPDLGSWQSRKCANGPKTCSSSE